MDTTLHRCDDNNHNSITHFLLTSDKLVVMNNIIMHITGFQSVRWRHIV